jgi:hypothetical protein
MSIKKLIMKGGGKQVNAQDFDTIDEIPAESDLETPKPAKST